MAAFSAMSLTKNSPFLWALGEQSYKLPWEWQSLGGIPVHLSTRAGSLGSQKAGLGIATELGFATDLWCPEVLALASATSGGAKPWQGASPTAGEPAAEQLCQAACITNRNPEFSGSLHLGLDHWIDLTKNIHSESVPGPGLWDSPEGFSHSHKPRVSMQPACNPGIVFLVWLGVDSRSGKQNIQGPANWLFPLHQTATHWHD